MHTLARYFYIISLSLYALIVQADPPSRVARISNIEGNVSFLPAGEEQWLDASRNRPFVTGDSLWNDSNGYSQAQLGGAKLCVGPNTNINVLNLDDKIAQFQLTEGSINLEVNNLSKDQSYEIDTPNVAFTVQKPGNYRIDVDKEGDATVVRVEQGQAQVFGDSNSYVINNDQAYQFTGTNLDYDPQFNAPPQDDFDKWCHDNKKAISRSTPRYVSQDIIGYEDLETAGTWETVEDYGPVWIPNNVDADWAPYRDGYWTWIEPWGWNWVGNESWGFAPYHYGRWVQHHHRWCWIPYSDGPAVYAPALVAFIGFGAGAQLAVGFGSNVGWFPLGPGDIYRPPYSVSYNYFTNINRGDRINHRLLREAYRNPNMRFNYHNRNVNNGFTAVPRESFGQSRNVNQARVRINADQIEKLPITSKADIKPPKDANKGRVSRFKPSEKALSREVLTKTPVPKETKESIEPRIRAVKPSKPRDISQNKPARDRRDLQKNERPWLDNQSPSLREQRRQEKRRLQQKQQEQLQQLQQEQRQQRRHDRIQQRQQEQLQQLQQEQRQKGRHDRIQQRQQEQFQQLQQEQRQKGRHDRMQQRQQEQLQQLQQEQRQKGRHDRMQQRQQEQLQQLQQEQRQKGRHDRIQQRQQEQLQQLQQDQRQKQRQEMLQQRQHQQRQQQRQEMLQQKQQQQLQIQQQQRQQQRQQMLQQRQQQQLQIQQQQRQQQRQQMLQQRQQQQLQIQQQQRQQQRQQMLQQRQQQQLQQMQQQQQMIRQRAQQAVPPAVQPATPPVPPPDPQNLRHKRN
ncbi:MAG: DUF6600 domain-containing protein [Candidatus Berkiella sp.]